MSKEFEVLEDRPDWKIFRTSCDCFSEDHIMEIELDIDNRYANVNPTETDIDHEGNIISLTFKYKVSPKDIRPTPSRFQDFINKVKLIFKIIFNQPINFDEEFIFRGKNHINEICDFIKEKVNTYSKAPD